MHGLHFRPRLELIGHPARFFLARDVAIPLRRRQENLPIVRIVLHVRLCLIPPVILVRFNTKYDSGVRVGCPAQALDAAPCGHGMGPHLQGCVGRFPLPVGTAFICLISDDASAVVFLLVEIMLQSLVLKVALPRRVFRSRPARFFMRLPGAFALIGFSLL